MSLRISKLGLLFTVILILIVSAILWRVHSSRGTGAHRTDTAQQHQVHSQPSVEKTSLESLPPVIISSIETVPELPTAAHDLKLEIITNYSDKQHITYEYSWSKNGAPLSHVKGDTLSRGEFIKGDRISIAVVPYINNQKGLERRKNFIVSNAPPSLSLETKSQKLADTVELSLISADPDGDHVTFGLEEPLEGMSIDKGSGKIRWKPEKIEQGVYVFKASVADSEGAKMTRTFEIKVDTRNADVSPNKQ